MCNVPRQPRTYLGCNPTPVCVRMSYKPQYASQCKSACSKQGVQRKQCSRHECCPLPVLVATSSACVHQVGGAALMCSSCGNPSTPQAGCHDKPNKVYEGVVEGCSLAGARLGVEQAFTEVLAILYSVIEHQDWCSTGKHGACNSMDKSQWQCISCQIE
jgi:hypothetical protein